MRGTASGRRAATVFYVLNALLLPISVIGYVIWLARIYATRRASGASITAQGPLSARAFMHQLGLRRDEAAYRLLLALPSTSRLGVLLAGGPMLLAHRLTGYVPSAFRHPFEGDVPPHDEASARVTFIDAAVERSLATIDQFVILGAGFDTRALRLPRAGGIHCFEVDTPRTQASKRHLLRTAGIDASGITFVAADFETADWLARLTDAGFAPRPPATGSLSCSSCADWPSSSNAPWARKVTAGAPGAASPSRPWPPIRSRPRGRNGAPEAVEAVRAAYHR